MERKGHFVTLLQFWSKGFYDVHPFFMLCSPPRCGHKRVDKIMTIFLQLMLKAQENTTGLKEPVMSPNETNGPLKHVKANSGPTFNRLLFIFSTATYVRCIWWVFFRIANLHWPTKNNSTYTCPRCGRTYIYMLYILNMKYILCEMFSLNRRP